MVTTPKTSPENIGGAGFGRRILDSFTSLFTPKKKSPENPPAVTTSRIEIPLAAEPKNEDIPVAEKPEAAAKDASLQSNGEKTPPEIEPANGDITVAAKPEAAANETTLQPDRGIRTKNSDTQKLPYHHPVANRGSLVKDRKNNDFTIYKGDISDDQDIKYSGKKAVNKFRQTYGDSNRKINLDGSGVFKTVDVSNAAADKDAPAAERDIFLAISNKLNVSNLKPTNTTRPEFSAIRELLKDQDWFFAVRDNGQLVARIPTSGSITKTQGNGETRTIKAPNMSKLVGIKRFLKELMEKGFLEKYSDADDRPYKRVKSEEFGVETLRLSGTNLLTLIDNGVIRVPKEITETYQDKFTMRDIVRQNQTKADNSKQLAI